MAYAQVILPVRLSWVPYYTVPDQAQEGMAVQVQMAGKPLIGVIRNLCERLPENLSADRVLPVEQLLADAPRIGARQLEFWQTISEYYLCTLGEVFKATFPGWEEETAKISSVFAKEKIIRWGVPMLPSSFRPSDRLISA